MLWSFRPLTAVKLMQTDLTYFQRLRAALDELPDDEVEPMRIDEFDGFVAGLLVAPAVPKPGKWLPSVWGAYGDDADYFPFEDFDEMQGLMDLAVCHYNAVAEMLDGGVHCYQPIFMREMDGSITWHDWASGFSRAIELTGDAWTSPGLDATPELAEALATLMTLAAVAEGESELPYGQVKKLERSAPEAIAAAIRTMAVWRYPQIAANDEARQSTGQALHRRGDLRAALAERLVAK